MRFEIGSWVKWSGNRDIRLGYRLSDVGQVVGVQCLPDEEDEIDVKFGNGDVLHGAVARWFEPAPPREEPETMHAAESQTGMTGPFKECGL